MIKVFISHKQEDSCTAMKIVCELQRINIPYYLDVLDAGVVGDGKKLTDHVKQTLNDCTDMIVVMSELTKYSQWVPFEVGMSAQNDMPTATFLKDGVVLPDFLVYWPRLKQPSDIGKYIAVRKAVQYEYELKHSFETAENRRHQIEKFYDVLKRIL